MLGDLDHLILRLARSAEALDLPDGAPSTGRTLVDFLKVLEPKLHYEVLSGTDWRPFAVELRQYLLAVARNLTPFRRQRPVISEGPALAGARDEGADGGGTMTRRQR